MKDEVKLIRASGYSLRPFRTGADRILLFSEPGFQTWRLNDDVIELEFDADQTQPEQAGIWNAANLTDVGISADGQMLASTHINGMVRLWEFTTNGFREEHPIHQQPIIAYPGRHSIVMAPDGNHFVTGSEDGFQVWRLNGTTCQRLTCSDNMSQFDGPVGFIGPSQFTTVGNRTPHHPSNFAHGPPLHKDSSASAMRGHCTEHSPYRMTVASL